MTVVVIDYGMGNLFSVRRALEVAGAGDIEVTGDPARLKQADRVILPGVGAFRDGMAGLQSAGFMAPLRTYAATGRPLLGICLGMQMLCDASAEFGQSEGLGLIPGHVEAIPRNRAEGRRVKTPVIGWAALQPGEPALYATSCLAHLTQGEAVYLLHSFQAQVAPEHLLATYDHHGLAVTAAVRRDNVTGVQFHPEKSGAVGLSILRAFLKEAM